MKGARAGADAARTTDAAPRSAPAPSITAAAVPWWRRVLTLPHVLTAVFLAVCGSLALTHALWIDEAQAFLIARDSRSLRELFANLRYEGHPPLWHLLLYGLTRFTTRPESMQVLHLAMAGASVYLVARFSPLPPLAKILFPFGYYPLFEYGVLARNYQLVMLLAFAFCALWTRRRTAYVRLALLLGLLCLSHLMGVLIAAGLGAMLLLDACLTGQGRAAIRRHPLGFGLGLLLAGGAAYLAVILLDPPADSGYAVGWNFTWAAPRAVETLSIFRDGLLPIPPRQVHFWDSHMLDDSPAAALEGVLLALAALAAICWSWRATLFFLIAALGQLLFSYVKFFGGVRHHGELFIALLAAFWIAWGCRPPARGPARPPIPVASRRPLWRRVPALGALAGITTLLAVHVYSGAVAGYFAWQVPFAAGGEAGRALRQALHPDDLLVADCEFVTPSLAVSVPGRAFYFPATNRWGTFVIWRRRGAWTTAGIARAQQLANERRQPVIFITAYRLPRLPAGVSELGYYNRAILEMEHFALYRISPPTTP